MEDNMSEFQNKSQTSSRSSFIKNFERTKEKHQDYDEGIKQNENAVGDISTQSSSRSVRIKHSGMVNSDHVKLSAKPSITTSCQDSELGDGYFERFSCSLESRTSSEYPLKRDPLKRDPKLILIAASDSCSNTDMDSSNSHYLGLDYQIKVQLLPILEKNPGLQFKKVRQHEGPWLEIECGNHKTYSWLKDSTAIVTSGPGVHIRFYPANNRYFHLCVKIPLTSGMNEKFSMNQFRQKCKRQNPGLDTWHWRLVDRRRVQDNSGAYEKETRVLLLEVPQQSVDYLAKHYWQLYYQFGRIYPEPFEIEDDAAIEEINIKCSRDVICNDTISFTKQALKSKFLLALCPLVIYLETQACVLNEEDFTEEIEMCKTNLSTDIDLLSLH